MFSDTSTTVPDVLEFFHVSAQDTPCIIAHDPANDAKYKSPRLEYRKVYICFIPMALIIFSTINLPLFFLLDLH